MWTAQDRSQPRVQSGKRGTPAQLTPDIFSACTRACMQGCEAAAVKLVFAPVKNAEGATTGNQQAGVMNANPERSKCHQTACYALKTREGIMASWLV